MNSTRARVAAATGAFYVIAIIAGEELMGAGSPGVVRAGYALVVLGFTAFVVFVAFLHRVLRGAEGAGGWLATLALSAGILHSAVRFAAQPPRNVEAYRGDSLSEELARTLEDLNDTAFVVTGLLLGVYVAAAGLVCLRHHVLPRWLGWFGTVAGVSAAVAGVVGMTAPDLYLPWPFLAGLIWTLIASVLLTIRPNRAAEEVPVVATPVRAG